MRPFLLLAIIFITVGCSRQTFLPVYPAVITGTGHVDKEIMLAIAQSYGMGLTLDPYFDTSRLNTIVMGTFSTHGVSLQRLLDVFGNEKVGFYIKNRTIHVYRRDALMQISPREPTALEPY